MIVSEVLAVFFGRFLRAMAEAVGMQGRAEPGGPGEPGGFQCSGSGSSSDSPAPPGPPAPQRTREQSCPPERAPDGASWVRCASPAVLENIGVWGRWRGGAVGVQGNGGDFGSCAEMGDVSITHHCPTRWRVLVRGLRLVLMVISRRFLGWFDLIRFPCQSRRVVQKSSSSWMCNPRKSQA